MRAPAMVLWVTLALAAPPRAVAADPAGARPEVKNVQESLQAQAKALERTDTDQVATKELRAARKWLVLAGWAADEGKAKEQRRMLDLAGLQLQLVKRLVALGKLRGEVSRLEQSLARIKGSIVEDKKRLEERRGYLDILRNIR